MDSPIAVSNFFLLLLAHRPQQVMRKSTFNIEVMPKASENPTNAKHNITFVQKNWTCI